MVKFAPFSGDVGPGVDGLRITHLLLVHMFLVLTKKKAGFGTSFKKIMAEGTKLRGPYLQFLTDGSHQNVPRTTKYRWQKKIRRTVDAVSCESDVPKESEPLNIDCSDVDTQEESACTHLLEPAVASSSLDEDCLQESDALAFTDSDCSNSCAWFFNESESTTFKCRFEEPAVTLKPFSFDKT